MKAPSALALVLLAAGCGDGTRGWHVGSQGIYRWASTITVFAWFGRAHPAPGQRAKANAELARLSP